MQNEEDYRQKVFNLLPNLVYLDDEDIQGNERESEDEEELGDGEGGEVCCRRRCTKLDPAAKLVFPGAPLVPRGRWVMPTAECRG